MLSVRLINNIKSHDQIIITKILRELNWFHYDNICIIKII